MTDKWFSVSPVPRLVCSMHTNTSYSCQEHVYQVAALRAFVPKDLLKIYDHADVNEYKIWDPMA